MRTVYTNSLTPQKIICDLLKYMASNKILECHAVRSLVNTTYTDINHGKKALSATYYTLRGVNLCIFVVVDDENS